MEKIYTEDFFSRCIPVWETFLSCFKNQPDLHFLEIGSYEGRSTCWLLDNILTDLTSKITCIDLFEGSTTQNKWSEELYSKYNMDAIYDRFISNISEYADNRVTVIRDYSYKALRNIALDNMFDCIYIDGSHIASDVLEDAILSFRLLKNNGIMIFDDYQWKMFDNELRHPQLGIDAFLSVYKKRYKILHSDYQLIIQKIELD